MHQKQQRTLISPLLWSVSPLSSFVQSSVRTLISCDINLSRMCLRRTKLRVVSCSLHPRVSTSTAYLIFKTHCDRACPPTWLSYVDRYRLHACLMRSHPWPPPGLLSLVGPYLHLHFHVVTHNVIAVPPLQRFVDVRFKGLSERQLNRTQLNSKDMSLTGAWWSTYADLGASSLCPLCWSFFCLNDYTRCRGVPGVTLTQQQRLKRPVYKWLRRASSKI